MAGRTDGGAEARTRGRRGDGRWAVHVRVREEDEGSRMSPPAREERG